jgi:hypothetical protein
VVEVWDDPPRFGSAFTGAGLAVSRVSAPCLDHGWVRFRAWARPEDAAAGRPSTLIALQVLHVAMVHTVETHPEVTCLVLRDGRWYVTMDVDDVLRVMEVLT